MNWVNYHGHSSFCDGEEHPETYIKEAVKLGMPAIGFSGHAPMADLTRWSIPENEFENYLQTIRNFKQKYKGVIDVYTGLEIDYIPNITGPDRFKDFSLDYVIGAIHFVGNYPNCKPFSIAGKAPDFDEGLEMIFGNDFRKAAELYFKLNCELIQNQTPDILAHSDLIKNHNKGRFSENEVWYQKAVFEMLDCAKEKDVIIEVNTRGIYKNRSVEVYPSHFALKRMRELNIRTMLSADTHLITELTTGFEQAAEVLLSVGYKEVTVLKNNHFIQVPFSTKGINY